MKLRALNGVGLRVSELCLGTMTFGTAIPRGMALRLLDDFRHRGGSFIDSANMYAHWLSHGRGGESESMIGEWLLSRRCRDEVVIATKVGFAYSESPAGLSKHIITRECERSLRRLRCDCIDVYFAHGDDESTPLDETLAAFDCLVGQGKVRSVGASNYTAARFREALSTAASQSITPFCCLQQRLSIIHPNPSQVLRYNQQYAWRDVREVCSAHKLPLLAYSVLLNGYFADETRELPPEYDHTEARGIRTAVARIASALGVTSCQVVLAFLLQLGIVPVIGVSHESQLRENIDATRVALSPENIHELSALMD